MLSSISFSSVRRFVCSSLPCDIKSAPLSCKSPPGIGTVANFDLTSPKSSFAKANVYCRVHWRPMLLTLANFKFPKEFFYVDEIKRAPSGKPDYSWAKKILSA